jgi:hypothetical protein
MRTPELLDITEAFTLTCKACGATSDDGKVKWEPEPGNDYGDGDSDTAYVVASCGGCGRKVQEFIA